MRAWKVELVDSGASKCMAGFNAVEFSPDHPDELGLWSKGVVPSIASGGGVP